MEMNDFQPLLQHLRSLGPFLFKPNGGNGGDAVIAFATIEFFNEHQLPWKIYTAKNYVICKTLVYGGGGGLLEQYSVASRFIEEHMHDLESFTLLPHSVSGHEALLSLFDSRCHLFARENKTYQYLLKHVSRSQISLSHDLALTLKPLRDPSHKIPLLLAGQPFHYQIHWLRKQYSLRHYFKNLPVIAKFFRTDSEASDFEHSSDESIDFSHLIKGRLHNERQIRAIATLFISLISRCDQIETDRLHVGIVAEECGKTCRIYPGNNFKIKEIYKHSLMNKSKSLHFEDV